MPAQSGLGFSGIVAIQIPDDGAAGTVLTKNTPDNYDYDWAAGGGGGGDVLTLTVPGGIFTLTQSSGVSPLTVDLVGGLSGAFLYKPGFAGGQLAHGGTAAGDELRLRGSTDADLGIVNVESPMDFDVDLSVSPASSILRWDTSFTVGAFIGGMIEDLGTVSITGSTFIWALLSETRRYAVGVTPAFAAFTLFNALPTIANSGNFNLLQALVLNVGVTHERNTSGTSTVIQTIGMSFSAQARATVSGAVLTYTTGMTAIRVSPTFSTVAGSTVNFGTIVGLQCIEPAVGLFQPAAGVENITAYYGLDWVNMAFGGASAVSSVVRSNQVSGTNRRFLDHTGTATSRLRGQIQIDVDLVGITYGASLDFQVGWAAANFYFEQQNTAPAGQLRKSSVAVGATAQRWLFTASSRAEFTWDCDRFSIGAQIGTNGNQVGNFVTPARTVTVGGDWADFLLTHAGSLTVNALALGRVSAWVINPVSYAASTGSVANADTLTVGGFPTSSPGVTITLRQSLFVIGGRSRFASVMQYNPITPAVLAAGNNNDWAGLLTGSPNNGMRHWARVQGDGGGTSVITGIDATAVQDGDTFKLTNISANNVTLGHQDANSAAANRIISPTGANYVLGADESAEIIYDLTTARFRILYGSGA